MKSTASFFNYIAKPAIIAATLLVLVLNAPVLKADSFVSKKAGSWSSSSTWTRTSGNSHTTPQNGDVVTIQHAITGFNGFTVGQNGTGGMSILAGGSLVGSSYLTVEKGFTLYNYGTLNISGLNFNGGNGTPASNFYNRGTATIGSGLNFWSNTSYIRNSGSLTINGSLGNGGTIIDSGTLVINGSYSSNNGTLTVGGAGSLTIYGSTQLTGATITVGSSTSTAQLNGAVSLNGSPTSKINNYGKFNIGTSSASYDVTANDGQIYNYSGGRFDIYGNLTLNSSNGTNQVQNADYFMVDKSMVTHGWSIVVNQDSMIVHQNFTNGSDFTNAAGAYLETGTDFFNQSKTNAKFTNDGYVLVKRNFTNDYNTILTGTGGGMKIDGVSTNNGTISGTQDVCDSTANATNKVDNNTGTVGNSVTSCQYDLNQLPVKLTAFSAERKGNIVQLRWQTASELGNSHFDVLRSVDGKNFIKIGEVQGHGTTQAVHSYTFNDEQPLTGTSYYMLRQVDFNGASENSPIASVKSGSTQDYTALDLYPNPVGNQALNLSFSTESAGVVTISLYSMAGNKMLSAVANTIGGLNTVQLDVQSLPAGLYILILTDGSNQVTAKFRK